ncbi:MAG: helix-turn-helix domain-containing protein [Propionicimonas sp.]|nr:helix-turn-helix domain-containing protein [Propionicimonas sp.]
MSTGLSERARAYAALGDPARLAIADLLASGDLSSGELSARLGIASNLLAHHLRVLERAGLVLRRRSEGDARRSYLQRTAACHRLLGGGAVARPSRVAFVCSGNSARSQLAAVYWRSVSGIPAVSAGTRPAGRVHPRAIAVAARRGLDLADARPRPVDAVLTGEELLVAVCDRAYEELPGQPLHWSVADPAAAGDPAFEAAFDDLAGRIDRLVDGIGRAPG